MLGQLTRPIILALTLFLSLAAHAQTVVDSLKTRLSEADNLRDSIMLMYNIYDSSPEELQGSALEDLYEFALRHDDYNTVCEVLKRSSSYYASNDSMQWVLINRARKLPDSPGKQSTLVYLNVKAAANLIHTLSETQIESKLRDYLTQHARSEKYDTYRRIEYLFILCMYLSEGTNGELLTNYLQELQTLIDRLPSHDLALKFLFYSQAADSYLADNMIPESVEANKRLLKTINDIRQLNAKIGRTSRNYDGTVYLCYDRLLRCHDAISRDDADQYFSEISALIESNPDLQDLSCQGKRPKLYHLMANKRYSDAMPMIREQLNDSLSTEEYRQYLVDAMLTASQALGYTDELLNALEMSNEMLKARIEKKAAESYNELQMIYDVNDLKETNDELMLANQQIEIKRHKDILTYSVICLLSLIILLVVMYVLYRRSKHLTQKLTKANNLIIKERHALERTQKDLIKARDKVKTANRMKTDFINNMGHEIRTPLESIVEYSGLIADCADTDGQDYIRRFADVITLNTDQLLTLVNDVLDLPSLENAKVGVNISKASLQNICESAIDNVRRYIKADIDLIFANEGQPDFSVQTDPERVEQVLYNLLKNAAKFTDRGSITLKYSVSPTQDKVTFTVTDTGIGITEGKEEEIFSRTENTGNKAHQNSLGLYISRMIADMLGGSLILDSEYHKGAKFIFTIPIQ